MYISEQLIAVFWPKAQTNGWDTEPPMQKVLQFVWAKHQQNKTKQKQANNAELWSTYWVMHTLR